MDSGKAHGTRLLKTLTNYLRVGLLAAPLLLVQCGTDAPPDTPTAGANSSGSGGAQAAGGSEQMSMGAVPDDGAGGMPESSDVTPPVFAGVKRVTAVSDSELNVTWDAATDDTTLPSSIAYRVYVAEPGAATDFSVPYTTTPAGATATTLVGLRAGVEYAVSVRAIDLSGNEDDNTVSLSARTPDYELPVFGGVATAESTTPDSVTLTWVSASDNATSPDDIVYEVFMSGTQGGEDFSSPLLVTEPGATEVTITGLDDATEYFFVVRAVDAGNNSDNNRREIGSLTDDGTKPVFAGAQTADAVGTAITIKWNDATDNFDPASYIAYRVYVSTTPGGQDFSTPLATTPKGEVKLTVPDLNVLTTYYYVVRAVDSAGNEDLNLHEVSATTAASPDVTPPTFAGLVSMTALSATSVSLQWAAATDDYSAQADIVYDVYVADAPGAEFFSAPSFVTPAGATSFVINGQKPEKTLYAVVRARDLIGHSDTNTVERSAQTLPDTSPPSFAGIVSATPTGTKTALLSWLPASDDASQANAIIYKVYQASAPGAENFSSPVATTTPGATQVVIGSLLPDQDYYFVVRAFDEYSNHDTNLVEKLAHTNPDVTAPVFAGATSASGQSPTSILVSWSPASDDVASAAQIQYQVYVATTAGGEVYTAPSATSAAGATSLLITGLTQNKQYYFVVRARDPYGNVDTNTVEVGDKTFPDTTAPTFAGASSLSGAGNTTMTVNWLAATDAVTPAASLQYLVCWSTTNGACATSFVANATVTGVTSYAATGLTPNTPYYFLVRARDAVGNTDANTTQRSASTTPDITPPTFAGLTSAVTQGPTSIRLNWTQGSDNATPQASLVYDIYMASAAGDEDYVSASFTTTAGVATYTVSGLVPNTPYYFVVRARDASGNRDANTTERTATTLKDTTAPTFAGAATIDQPTETSLRVNWLAASDDTNLPGAITYQVCVGSSAGACATTFTTSYTTAAGATSQVVTGLQPSTVYYVVVRATDSYGNQDANTVERNRSTLADTTAPTFAGATNVSGATDTKLTVNWSAATDNVTSGPNLQYEICRATTAAGCSGASFTATQTVTGVTSYQFTSGLSPNTTYYFVVRAFDQAGLTDGNSTVVSGATVNDTTNPTFAGLVSATQAGATSIDLAWAAASDNVSSAAQIVYDIYQATSAGGQNFASPSYTTSAGDTGYTVLGLNPITAYYFVVRARDQAGNDDTNTTERSATTAADTTAPSFAGVTNISGITASTVNLSWAAATDNVTPQASLLYDVCVTTVNGGCNNASFAVHSTSAAGATSKTVTGLTPLTLYYFVVRARDAVGNRGTSNVQVSGTTIADSTAPTFAGATSVDNATITTLRVNWAAATDNAPGSIFYDVCYTLVSGNCDNGAFVAMATSAANATSLTLTGLTPNKTYYVIAHARDGANNSDANNVQRSGATLVDSTAPTFAGASSVDNATLTSLRVNWTQATDAGTPQASISYDICYSSTFNACTGGGFVALATVTGVSSYTTPTTLVPGTTYYFVVRAKDGSGNSGANNVQASGATLTDSTAPTGGVATLVNNATSTSLRINFSQATDNYAAGNIDYRICWTTGAAAPTCTTNFTANFGATVTNSPLFYTVSNLTPDTTYYFVVRARDQFGNESTNTTSVFGTTSSDSTPPVWQGGPTLAYSFTGASMTTSRFTVSWTAATDAQWANAGDANGSADIYYSLCWSTSSIGCSGASFAAMANTAYNTTSYLLTNLARRTTYYVWVRPNNRSGFQETGNHVASAQSATSYNNDVKPIFDNVCNTCHGAGVWQYSTVVNIANAGAYAPGGFCGGVLDYVEPDSASSSYIFRKMSVLGQTTAPFNALCTNQYAGARMPNGGPYDATNISIMQDWITGLSASGDGAPFN
jgi:hypothetical protein